MTIEEFSNEFDTLLGDNRGIFDEYEKSVFLTKAQEEVVKGLYNGTITGTSFEHTEELRRYLSSLVKTNKGIKTTGEALTSNSYFFKIPKDVWFITYEFVISKDDKLGCYKNNNLEVVPVTQDELYKTENNPFRSSNKRRVLRLDLNEDSNNVVELISKYNIDEYTIRYLSAPTPIILINLPENLTINNYNKESECKLNPALHRLILEMAVKYAISSKGTGK